MTCVIKPYGCVIFALVFIQKFLIFYITKNTQFSVSCAIATMTIKRGSEREKRGRRELEGEIKSEGVRERQKETIGK